MNKAIIVPIVLQLVGVGVIIAEVIVPSGGILAILATALIGYSLYLVFSGISVAVGTVFVVLDALLIPVLVIWGLKMLAKSPLALKNKLDKKNGYTSQDLGLEKLSGMEGESLTDLRPAGMAMIDGKRVDVVSRGEYIGKKSPIVVLEVTGNQVIVGTKET